MGLAPHASDSLDVDGVLESPLQAALATLDERAPLLSGMARYHLGYVDAAFATLPAGAVDRGKRIRPAIALLTAGAVGNEPQCAAPIAAALELLHNFTLVHDDIQDQSPMRRHRPTVWSLWGIGQAINAGDALFAAAHLPLFNLIAAGVPGDRVLRLLESFDRMTLEIVAGQTLDLSFETRGNISANEYLAMISGKTAAIVRYAAWAGALVAGANLERASQWGAFGLAVGMGFQIRDDLLGIWGAAEETGKAPADDVRRRKQSYPILLLRERLAPAEQEELTRLFASAEVDSAGVGRVLQLLDRESIRGNVEAAVLRYHDEALAVLATLDVPLDNPYRQRLLALVERLSLRTG